MEHQPVERLARRSLVDHPNGDRRWAEAGTELRRVGEEYDGMVRCRTADGTVVLVRAADLSPAGEQ